MKIRKVHAPENVESERRTVRVFGGGNDRLKSCFGFGKEKESYVAAPGLRVLNLRSLSGIVAVHRLSGANCSLISANGDYLWEFSDKSGYSLLNVGKFQNMSAPCAIYGYNKATSRYESGYAIFSQVRCATRYESGNYAEFGMVNPIRYATVHMGRIFAIDRDNGYIIRWSSRTFNDWTQGAEKAGALVIECDLGPAMWLAEYNDDLVIFCLNGIKIMHALGDAMLFGVGGKGKFRVSEALVTGSSVLCGGKLYFCSEKSLYSFDGASVERIVLNGFEGKLTFKYITPVESGKLFLSVLLEGTPCVVIYDTASGSATACCKNLSIPVRTDKGTYGFKSGVPLRFDETVMPDEGYLLSDPVDFGTSRTKFLRTVKIDCTGKATLKITTEKCVRTFNVSGGLQKLYVGVGGKNFTFNLTGCGKIFSVEAEAEIIK